MKELIASFLSGVIFSIGLAVSGMTRPGKVTGFLDFLGDWDPSLAFVMVGAILVYSIGYRNITKKRAPLFAKTFQLPTNKKIDRNLVAGSLLFGIGWGLAGFCPGPALTSLVTLSFQPLVFVAAMLLGMAVFALNQKKSAA